MTRTKLVLLHERPAGSNPSQLRPDDNAVLNWQFDNTNGQLLASGKLTSPLLETSEFDANGQPAPVTATAGAATFDIELPNASGTLNIDDPAALAGGTRAQTASGSGAHWSVAIPRYTGSSAPLSGSGGSTGTTGGGGGASGSTTTSCGTTGDHSRERIETGPTTQIQTATSGCTAFTFLVVAEGYTKDQKSQFDRDARALIAAMGTVPGYAENWKYVSAYEKFFVSKQTGISDPSDPACGQKDTAFRVTFGNPRRVVMMQSDVPLDSMKQLAEARSQVHADAVLVVLNTTVYAGAGGGMAFSSVNSASRLVVAHEMGHTLFHLFDEYGQHTASGQAVGVACHVGITGGNVASDLASLPWSSVLTPGVALPTVGGNAATVGAYEGADYCDTGEYRAQQNCIMRNMTGYFCAACRLVINKTFQQRLEQLGCASKDAGSEATVDAGPDAASDGADDATDSADAASDGAVDPQSLTCGQYATTQGWPSFSCSSCNGQGVRTRDCAVCCSSCVQDVDCPSGEVCSWNGVDYCCRQPGPSGTLCTSGIECASGQVCAWNGQHYYCMAPVCD